MQPLSSTSDLNYIDEFPSEWAERLRAIKNTGATTVRTEIFWGAHEPVRGMRDFSKASRLRVERFLKLAHEEKLQVEMVLGFPPGKETLPAWVYENSKPAWVPAAVWRPDAFGYGLAQVPALFDPSFRTAFLEFAEEMLSLVALYLGPGGPVTSLVFDAGIYEADLTAMENPAFLPPLQERYPTLEDLNRCYHTAFKDFSAISTRQGFRTLSDKRPWLAAYDYKLGRQSAIAQLYREIAGLPSFAAVSGCFQEKTLPESTRNHGSAWSVALDATLIDLSSGTKALAFAPAGHVNETAFNALRLWEYFQENCEEALVDFSSLHQLKAGGRVVVVTGKFLSRAQFLILKSHLEVGGELFFPLALPQYDENLKSLDWSAGEKKPAKSTAGSLLRFTAGKGTGWLAVPAFDVDDSLWGRIVQLSESWASESSA